MDLIFGHGDWVLQGTFLFLVLMSVVSWTVIVGRIFSALRVKSKMKQHRLALEKDMSRSYAEVYEELQGESPFKQILASAVEATQTYQQSQSKRLQSISYSDYLMRNVRFAYDSILASREAGLTFLATIGATAPFVGLFGTVWGIYHALANIASMGTINIATISGPIGEALIATAFGLFVAIPAVLAYNLFNRSNRVFARQIDVFAHDIYGAFLSENKE
ncbi:hypothetical protein IX83_04805 [Basilea psittacipulmonis DSM 24701]|uniref:Biopolymer transport protein ExbB n=1 Tax=Basilea psittacipulmonis DSM 24701 TaxID=1072685 RepID=A0A077DF06_9BURK|nr:hypothetical protein IX83_04805 [Basilea psittacipulmonis DSM 24701]